MSQSKNRKRKNAVAAAAAAAVIFTAVIIAAFLISGQTAETAESIESNESDGSDESLITADTGSSQAEAAAQSEMQFELTDYYGDLSSLITAAGLETTDGGYNYIGTQIEIYFTYPESEKRFIVSCFGGSCTAYGVKIGDDKEQALASIASYGLMIEAAALSEDSSCVEVYIWDDAGSSDVIGLSLSFDDEGTVESWSVTNWPQGEIVSMYIYFLKAGHEAGITAFADWQSAYFNWIVYNHENYASDCEYTLVYIDDDDIPELYMDTLITAGGAKLVYYNGEETVSVFLWTYGLSYLEKQNLFMDSGGHMDEYYDNIYTISDGQFELVAYGEYGAENNSDIQLDEDGKPIYVYSFNGEETTGEGYSSMLAAVYDSNEAIRPYGKYDSETGLYGGFYDIWGILDAIVELG